uniref:Potassium channel Kv3.1 n=1 Tax=Notoplana atomata TaxID=221862 RepID=Q86MY5_9PLAT|nr:potassium channel Kv3.1 [Notoplana atomata]
MMAERVVINVSGQRFETIFSTLERFPETRLSSVSLLKENDESFDASRKEYFFDRHPGVFASILNYYRTEELHLDSNVCGNVVKKEFDFWGMQEQDIEPCCWGSFSRASECKATLAAIDNTFMPDPFVTEEAWNKERSAWRQFKIKAWRFLEHPETSMPAKIYVSISMLFVIISIVSFVIETWGPLREPLHNANKTKQTCETTCCGVYYDHLATEYDPDDTKPKPFLIYIDIACYCFFITEMVLRILFTCSYKRFFKDWLNWIDILCNLIHSISIILLILETDQAMFISASSVNRLSSAIRTLRGLRIIRVLRMFKLMKHYSAFRILLYSIVASARELILMIAFLLMGSILFGSIVYMIDKKNFTSIPYGLWWALVTMTTVGYGDYVPREPLGYIVGSVCVIFGVLMIAFTVPIVVSNFSMYYEHAQSRSKRPRSYWTKKRVPGQTPRSTLSSSTERTVLTDVDNSRSTMEKGKTEKVTWQKLLNDLNPDKKFRASFRYYPFAEPNVGLPDTQEKEADKEKSRRLLKQLREAQHKLEQEKRRQALAMKVKKDRAKSRRVNPDVMTPRDVEVECDTASVPENI